MDQQDELRELQREYLGDVRDKLQLIRSHASALSKSRRFKTSFPVLLFITHQLKGSGGSLGFPSITDVAREMNVELNRYLEDDVYPRPTLSELSKSVEALSHRLAIVVEESERSVAI